MSKEEKTPLKIDTIPVEDVFENPYTTMLFYCDVCEKAVAIKLNEELICPDYDETHRINDIMRS